MKLSLDNGRTFYDADEICQIDIDELDAAWDALVWAMDDDTREAVHAEYAPCSNAEFLSAYLKRAPYDLVIG